MRIPALRYGADVVPIAAQIIDARREPEDTKLAERRQLRERPAPKAGQHAGVLRGRAHG